ncbi:hypothetical protein [Agromyces sp. SYSU T0242]|uniref:hypothetical protein n=1 Tax=Agromyces litoreus TaxID=3158561 RepID=UPI0033998735
MSGDGYEYPDEAGYPDGTGTLHEGTDRVDGSEATADAADAAEEDLESFAMGDERDADGD